MIDKDHPWDFLVDRTDLHRCKVAPAQVTPDTPLDEDDILVKVERYVFTANNITYAALGETMKYWNFFPAAEGWGRIPAWGYARVVRSNHPDVHSGERLFGYFPMSSYLVMTASRVRPAALVDASVHRSGLAPAYNHYVRLATQPAREQRSEDREAIIRPLIITSFLIADLLAEMECFGAQRVVLSSASSKLALGIAWALRKGKTPGIQLVGLTSPGNKAFVESVGWYDDVATYDAIDSLPVGATIFVDMAGSADTIEAVHRHWGEALKYSLMVGGTHWDAVGRPQDLPGAEPIFFFAPDMIVKRNAEWGQDVFNARVTAAVEGFVADSADWLSIEEISGPEAVEQAYLAMVDGRYSPDKGFIFVQ